MDTMHVTCCDECGIPIPSSRNKGRPRRWCSQRCRTRSYNARQGIARWGSPEHLKKLSKAGKRWTLRSYESAETRARTLVPKAGCALADSSCKGSLEMTFRHEAPSQWIRSRSPTQNDGRLYWVGPADRINEAYRWLCISHHSRTDPARIQGFHKNGIRSVFLLAARMRASRPLTSGEGTAKGYLTSHHRARKQIADRSCLEADQTCRGKIFASLRLTAPTDHLFHEPQRGRVYSVSPNDYDPLCQSHAQRRDLRGR